MPYKMVLTILGHGSNCASRAYQIEVVKWACHQFEKQEHYLPLYKIPMFPSMSMYNMP